MRLLRNRHLADTFLPRACTPQIHYSFLLVCVHCPLILCPSTTVSPSSLQIDMEPIPSLTIPPTKSLHELLGFNPQVTQMPYKRTVACPPLDISHTSCSLTAERSFSRFPPDQLRKGSEVLVEALKREGVKDVFTSTGDESMEIIQEALLTCPDIIRNHKGGIFAADGYARSSGLPGVYFASSGATDLISGITDARLDSVPIVAITGQETPVVEAARSLSKKDYLVLDVQDIPRTVREAFFVASSGRPGPVLIHIPEDIRQKGVLSWGQSMGLPRYMARLPQEPQEAHLEPIIRLVWESKKPVLFLGDGCWNSSEELKKFVELTGIPVASNLMGLGAYPVAEDNDLSLGMVGMHGSVYANDAVDRSDLLLAFGVKSDDRVTGRLEAFASRATIVHIDIDSAEIGKTKHPHVSVCADVKFALKGLNKILEGKIGMLNLDFSAWRKEHEEQKVQHPLNFRTFGDAIPPPYAIQVLDELTNGNAIISTGVGHHQMWAAQFYKYNRPRQWLTSGGLGFMGFGLPAAIGAAVARPDSVVVNIDDNESFVMNVQELATIRVENLPVKIMVLNNPHLSPVLREDCFSGAYGTYKYLSNPPKESEIFPNMLKFAEACEIPAARVMKKDDLGAAMQEMLGTPGPYLLDVIVPHLEHVLPVGYPSGGASIGDVITEGNGDQNVDKLKQHFGYKEKNKKLKMKKSPFRCSVL